MQLQHALRSLRTSQRHRGRPQRSNAKNTLACLLRYIMRRCDNTKNVSRETLGLTMRIRYYNGFRLIACCLVLYAICNWSSCKVGYYAFISRKNTSRIDPDRGYPRSANVWSMASSISLTFVRVAFSPICPNRNTFPAK